MDLSTTLQIALLVIMVIVIFFELWLLRRKKGARKATRAFERDDEFDDARNAITSTEKIASIMRGQGVDTTDADAMLREAKRAHARGDRTFALAKASAARTSLMNSKKKSSGIEPMARLTRDFTPEPETERGAGLFSTEPTVEAEQSPEEIPKDSAPKLPDNYLQSKFMISTAEGSVRSAISRGKEVSAADKALMQAKASFEAGDYAKALSMALKAKKQAEGLPAGPAKGEEGPAMTDVGAPATEGVERWKEENPPAKGFSGGGAEKTPAQPLACPDCSAALSTDDAFCRKCGAKLEFQIICPGCGVDLEKGDAFCRKCGTKLL